MTLMNYNQDLSNEVQQQLDSDFKHNNYWKVLHNVTLKHQGTIAHIDHLIISRTLDFWICSSKNLGLDIEDEGLLRFAAQQILQQNIRSINVLYKSIIDHQIKLPTKCGLAIPPTYNNLILVPPAAHEHLSSIRHLAVRTVTPYNKVFKTLTNKFNTENPLKLLRLVSMKKLKSVTEQLKTI